MNSRADPKTQAELQKKSSNLMVKNDVCFEPFGFKMTHMDKFMYISIFCFWLDEFTPACRFIWILSNIFVFIKGKGAGFFKS